MSVPKKIFSTLGLKSETELYCVSNTFGDTVKCFSITQKPHTKKQEMNRVKQQLFADYPLNKGQRMIQIIFHIIFDRLHVSYDHVLMAENEILPSRSISSYCFLLSQKKKKKKARMVWSEACEFKRHDVNIQESRVFSFFLFMFVYDITFSRNLTTNDLHYKLVC